MKITVYYVDYDYSAEIEIKSIAFDFTEVEVLTHREFIVDTVNGHHCFWFVEAGIPKIKSILLLPDCIEFEVSSDFEEYNPVRIEK
mgnify:CR=1 FL=1